VTEAEWRNSGDAYAMLCQLVDLRGGRPCYQALWRARLRQPRWYPGGLDWWGDRNLRLLACAYCRRVVGHLTQERSWRAIEANERFADGEATREELAGATRAARAATGDDAEDEFGAWDDLHQSGDPCRLAAWAAAYLGVHSDSRPGVLCALDTAAWAAAWLVDPSAVAAWLADPVAPAWAGKCGPKDVMRPIEAGKADLVRELFGNPFRPTPAVDSVWMAWQGGTVARLAQAAYEVRRLPDGTLDPARLAVLADALEDAGCADAELLGHLRGPGVHVRGCWAVDLLLSRE
jgi:hypothetical protein